MASAPTLANRAPGLLQSRLRLGSASRVRRAPLLHKLADARGHPSIMATDRSIIPIAPSARTRPRTNGLTPEAATHAAFQSRRQPPIEFWTAAPSPLIPPSLSAISPIAWRVSTISDTPHSNSTNGNTPPATQTTRILSKTRDNILPSSLVRAAPMMFTVGGQVRPIVSDLPNTEPRNIANRPAVPNTSIDIGPSYSLIDGDTPDIPPNFQFDDQSTSFALPTTIPTGRQPRAVLSGERRQNAPELPTPLAPPPQSPPHSGVGMSGPTQGTIYLDGSALGQWLTTHLEQAMSQPNRGPSGVDPRVFPVWGPVSAAF
jgi:hypothetical protein